MNGIDFNKLSKEQAIELAQKLMAQSQSQYGFHLSQEGNLFMRCPGTRAVNAPLNGWEWLASDDGHKALIDALELHKGKINLHYERSNGNGNGRYRRS